MLTTAGVTAFTMGEKLWANCGGTPAAVLTVAAGGVNTSAAPRNAPANPLPKRKFILAFMT